MDHLAHKTIFVDIETGGTNPKRHPIIQLAGIAVDSTLSPLEAFEVKIRFDERDAKQASLRKNHYRRGVWANEAIEAHDAAQSFAQFLRRHATVPAMSSDGKPYKLAQLVAHNANFDGEFLWTWYERLGIFFPARRQLLCTLQRALWYFSEEPSRTPPKDFKLATLCEHFEVSFHAAKAHDALADVTATLSLYRSLQGSFRLRPPCPVLSLPATSPASCTPELAP